MVAELANIETERWQRSVRFGWQYVMFGMPVWCQRHPRDVYVLAEDETTTGCIDVGRHFMDAPFDFKNAALTLLANRAIAICYAVLIDGVEVNLECRLAWEPTFLSTARDQVDEVGAVIEEEFRRWIEEPAYRVVLMQPNGWVGGRPVLKFPS